MKSLAKLAKSCERVSLPAHLKMSTFELQNTAMRWPRPFWGGLGQLAFAGLSGRLAGRYCGLGITLFSLLMTLLLTNFAQASCGDYVHLAHGRMSGKSQTSHQVQQLTVGTSERLATAVAVSHEPFTSKRPCSGPQCRQRQKPDSRPTGAITPTASAGEGLVEPGNPHAFAKLRLADWHLAGLDESLLAGHCQLPKRPPRAQA